MNTSKDHDMWADHDAELRCNGVCEYCPEFGHCDQLVTSDEWELEL